MTRTFSPCSDIETRKMLWAMYQNGTYVGISDAVKIAGSFARKYSKDVK